MTRAGLFTLLGAILMLALSHSTAHAQPSQTSLVRAWEEVQRNDPETVVFEKVGEMHYHFKTNRFPFDGELRVLKATVDDSSSDYDNGLNGFLTGVIEYDLVGLSPEVARKYEHSFENWETTNTLYFDKESGSWLSAEKQRIRMAAKVREMSRSREQQEQSKKTTGWWLYMATSWLPIVLLVGFWAWLLKRTGLRRQREYMNMGAKHMQTVEELLERIAAAVEGRAKQ